MPTVSAPPPGAPSHSGLYRAFWRWHFYAGLLTAPVLAILAVTGLAMLLVTGIVPETGEWRKIPPGPQALSIADPVDRALAAHPGSGLVTYVTPWGPDHPALVRIDAAGTKRLLTIDPYRGDILRDVAEEASWKSVLTRVHGTLLLGGDGGPGDLLIEVAASLGILLTVTGLYLWWPRPGTGLAAKLFPRLRMGGRMGWKALHETAGAWMAVVLVFFLVSGLAWAGLWGANLVQPWSSFPAEKWDNVPLSDKLHASMNHDGMKDVPWALEQTPMPRSGSPAGTGGLASGTPVTPDALVALGRQLGFSGRFQLAAPQGDTGVWTLSQDSMSYDSASPAGDRTVHVDRYSGRILADVRFADYSLPGKAMAVGVALHEGQLGWWNVILNAAFCLGVLFATVSGAVMWWKRRPSGELAAPRYSSDFRPGAGLLVLLAAVGLAFPAGGAAMAVFAVVDLLLPRRITHAGFRNS